MASLKANKVCLKGTLWAPLYKENTNTQSLNVTLRKNLDLYVNLVHAFSIPGVKTRHEDIDIVIVRENTEGEYSGLEHEGTMRNEQEAAFPSQRKRSIASDADAAF